MIDIQDCGKGSTNQEIQIFLKSLKPRMKLPLLNDYGCTDHYLEQLIAEHYLNGLLEGYTLKFMTTRLVKYLGNLPYLKMNERLMSISITMSDVIERRELNLNFEFDYAGGLLLHNYTENEECDQHEDQLDQRDTSYNHQS